MSKKRVKAWAVVDKDGAIQDGNYGIILRTYTDYAYACAMAIDADGERVVPVTIVLEEEK